MPAPISFGPSEGSISSSKRRSSGQPKEARKRRSSGQRKEAPASEGTPASEGSISFGAKKALSAQLTSRAHFTPNQSLRVSLSASVSPNQSLRVSLSASASRVAAEAFAEASSDERAAFAAAMLTAWHFRRDCSFARSLPRGERSSPRPERSLRWAGWPSHSASVRRASARRRRQGINCALAPAA